MIPLLKLIFLSTLLLAAHVGGQTLDPVLQQAAKDYDQAQMTGDRPALERLVADDYILINSAGKMQNKADLIDGFNHPGLRMEPFRVQLPFTKQLGNVIILGGWAELKGIDGGKPFSQKLRFADMWTKRNGTWQLVFTQVTPSPQP